MTVTREEALRALESGEFLPYFQPLVSMRTGELAGFEMLARWRRAGGGLVLPDAFIPSAEQEGWIDALTHYLLGKAFAVMCSTPASLSLAINISPVQLRNRRLASEIEEVAGRTAFPMHRLTIEITESALTENPEQARAIADDLKQLGCTLALDDFGTGYSSLRHLQSLPFDELKVDRSFVGSMAEQRDSRKIVAAVVGLGQSLGLTTVAEGVETEEHASMLRWLGCDIAQGWLYGKPVPEAALALELSRPRALLSPSAFPAHNWSAANLEALPAQRLAQLQAIYDGAPVGLGFLDRSFRYVSLNQRLAEMNGTAVAEHLGRTAQEVRPDLFPTFAPCLQQALLGIANTDFEVHQPESGEQGERTFLTSYQPARDEAGEIVGISVAVLDFTERKKSEERLEEYQRVVEGLEEMIVVVDRTGRYVLANRAFVHYLNIPPEQLIGSSVPGPVNEEVFKTVIQPKLEECFRGHHVAFTMAYDFPLVGPRELHVSYSPIEVGGGTRAAACVIRDITDVRRMEIARLGWQKRIELAEQAGLRIGLWDWDIKSNTVVWSDESYRQWGFRRDTFSGRVEDATARIHPEDRPIVENAIQRVLSHEAEQYSAQYRVLRPDGSICWIAATGVILRETSPHMIGVGIDITDVKLGEHRLRESEEKYLLLLNSTAEGIYGVDLEGKCTFCNPAGLRMLGYSTPDDVLGKNMHLLSHHSHPDGTAYPIAHCAILSAIRNGTTAHRSDEVLWRSDGQSFPVEYWSHPMFRNGSLAGAVVTFLDLSRRDARG